MFLLLLTWFVVVVLFIAFMVTQIIMPMLNSRPLFPFFRKTTTSLESEVTELKAQLREEDLVDEALGLQDQLTGETLSAYASHHLPGIAGYTADLVAQ